MNAFFENFLRSSWLKTEIQDVEFQGKHFKVLRDDLIHPVISGNKLRKLWLYLREALKNNKGIETFGGPFSNHLIATAFAAYTFKIPCRAYVRGLCQNTPSLEMCQRLGMQLQKMSSDAYRRSKNLGQSSNINWLTVPEGGKGPIGVEGVRLSYKNTFEKYDEIWLAAGTLTTALGVALAAPHTRVVAVPVLKVNGIELLSDFMSLYCIKVPENLAFADDYHFGGYAKWTAELLEFANEFYLESGIMTDLVYTAKSLYAFIHHSNSPSGVRKLWIHTGGLQGMIGILPQIKKKKLHLAYETPLVAHLSATHLAINGPKPE
ncbi:1-aminocyclopropane-1-carboxylate deaminase/D-cysteine desulfhydrase [Thermaurantimonas aggregans]|nr:pyridoxal-phosphate dependent enzyme [Thermaurantimonas aggregans]MCX8149629.1 pyridoxal-phosphate dependent enzyme [Thermaurantimonas aggregans]